MNKILPIDAIKKNPQNPRIIKDDKFKKLVKSIKEFPEMLDIRPIVVNSDMVILGGNMRYTACVSAGLKEIPVIIADGLSEDQQREFIIKDNVSGGEWDWEMLANEWDVAELDDWGLDMPEMSQEPTEGLTDEDAVPEVPTEPVARLGDIWTLGNHRLMCGDSTSVDAVGLLMNGEKADMVVTSPPYNANTKLGEGDIFAGKKVQKLYADGHNDKMESSEYVDFAKSVLEICFLNTDGYIFWNVSYNSNSKNEYIKQIVDRIDFLIEQICWKKSSSVPFKGCLKRDYEPIFVFSTNKKNLATKSVESNIWEISNRGANTETHKACFPVGLPEKAIALVPIASGIVFEPFGGSGTTMIACEKLGRKSRLMELDPKYCDVIIKRWQDFTGKEAVLSDGRTFSEVSSG